MIIAFCGPSASGKSTLIKRIKHLPYFEDREVAVKEEDDFFIIDLLKKLIGQRPFSDYKNVKFFQKEDTKRNKIFSLLVSNFYPLVVFLEFLIYHIYYEVIFKDKVLIKDQYIYSYIITFKDVIKISNPLIEYFYKRFPKPYLSFFIKISLATSISRNKNKVKSHIASNLSLHKKVLVSYDELAKLKKALVIKNDNNLESSIGEVEEHILAKNKLINAKRISISGLDGSGKTTVAKLLCDYARKLNIKCTVSSFYYQSIPFKFLKWLGVWKASKTKIGNNKRGNFLMPWAILVLLDSYIQYFFYVFFYHKSLIIFDRFFYDYLVSFKYLKVAKFKFFIPDIENKFLLLCNPMVCFKRKREAPLVYLRHCDLIYKTIAKNYEIRTISTSNKTPSDTLKESLSRIKL